MHTWIDTRLFVFFEYKFELSVLHLKIICIFWIRVQLNHGDVLQNKNMSPLQVDALKLFSYSIHKK